MHAETSAEPEVFLLFVLKTKAGSGSFSEEK
jgi:hypothetical protein